MNRFLVLLVVLALVLGLAAARSQPKKNKGRNKEGSRREGKGNNEPTSVGEWTWGECVPNKGSCGKGQKTGNCSGELCEVPTKTADCRVKCTKEAVTTEAPVQDNGEEVLTTQSSSRGGGRPGKGRRPGKDRNGETQESKGKGSGRREKPPRGERRPNKTDKPSKTKECKYARATLSECDPITNLQNKTRVLKGTPSTECPEVIVDSVRCDRRTIRQENRHCNYTLGEFGPCNETTNTRTRQDTLIDPTQVSEECRLVRTIEDKCPKSEGSGRGRPMRCRYNWEQAPACNESTITLTGSLVIVEGSPEDCEAVKTHQLNCKKGKVPCVLGEWGEFSECLDGIKTRTRKLQKGPHVCQRLTRESVTCE